MSKKPVAKDQAAPAKSSVNKINRTRRNAMERKCIPKAMKTLWAGSGTAVFREIEKLWREGRKRKVDAT